GWTSRPSTRRRCGHARSPSGAARPRCSVPSSPSACSACRVDGEIAMYFALTDDQRDFSRAVREFLRDRFDLEAVRGVVEDPEGDGHPGALWTAMGEQGWLAVLVPEEHDGLGLGMVDAQAI